jgi:hypothetical protein
MEDRVFLSRDLNGLFGFLGSSSPLSNFQFSLSVSHSISHSLSLLFSLVLSLRFPFLCVIEKVKGRIGKEEEGNGREEERKKNAGERRKVKERKGKKTKPHA